MLKSLIPVFVDTMPDDKKEGILYISLKYETAIHLCPCGCGNMVVTPFHSPDTDWTLTIEPGDRITLHPSVGNFAFPCKSHYWVRGNQIIPA